MNNQAFKIPESSPIIVGQPVYRSPPRRNIQIPVYQRPLFPVQHMHSHTTVFFPIATPLPQQTHIINPSVFSIAQKPNIDGLKKYQFPNTENRKIEQQIPKVPSAKQSGSQLKLEDSELIKQVINQNKLIKQQNEQLRIQNGLLVQKLQNLTKKIQLQKRIIQDKELFETDAQSLKEQISNRIKRVKSFQYFRSSPPISEEIEYTPSIINCCDKCTKSVLQNKLATKNSWQQKSQCFQNIHRQNFKTDYKTDPDEGWVKIQKARQRQLNSQRKRQKNSSQNRSTKNQDMNSLIKRLKQENNALKRLDKYQ